LRVCAKPQRNVKFWDVSVAPIFDAEGKPVRLLSTSRDITERKRIEEEIENARDAALESARLNRNFWRI
jgi:PAS domain-containing protein